MKLQKGLNVAQDFVKTAGTVKLVMTSKGFVSVTVNTTTEKNVTKSNIIAIDRRMNVYIPENVFLLLAVTIATVMMRNGVA